MNDSQYASRRLSDLETELQIMKMNNLKIERELAAEKSMISTTNKSLSLSDTINAKMKILQSLIYHTTSQLKI
jgi:hypothetical protein